MIIGWFPQNKSEWDLDPPAHFHRKLSCHLGSPQWSLMARCHRLQQSTICLSHPTLFMSLFTSSIHLVLGLRLHFPGKVSGPLSACRHVRVVVLNYAQTTSIIWVSDALLESIATPTASRIYSFLMILYFRVTPHFHLNILTPVTYNPSACLFTINF